LSRIQEIIIKQKDILNNKINLTNLQKSNLINKKHRKLKLLGTGDLKQKFDIEVNSISKSAKEKIEKLGGKVTLIK
jgi:large subunit ribosomal protein L15